MMWLLLISMPLAPSSAMPTGERRGIFEGRARARVVHDLVATHVKHTRRTRCIGEDEHPHAVVVTWLPAILPWRALRTKMPKKLSRFRWPLWLRYAVNLPRRVRRHRSACKVGDHLRSGRGEGGDPVLPVVEGTISHKLGVAFPSR